MRTEDLIRRVRLALAGRLAPELAAAAFDRGLWKGVFTVEKFSAAELLADPRATPYEVVTGENLLVTSGANAYHSRLIATSVTAFVPPNGALGVGTGNTPAPAIAQTDLQGGTKFRKVIDATPSISGNQISFVSTFPTTDANFAWEEAGIFNSVTLGAGVMLNRVVQSFGTKTSSFQWVLTGTITLA